MNIDERCYGYQPAQDQLDALRKQNSEMLELLRGIRTAITRYGQARFSFEPMLDGFLMKVKS